MTKPPNLTGNGRPRLHADNAAKQRAYRARNRLIELRMTIALVAKVDELAKLNDLDRSEMVHSMLSFALMNRDWKRDGHFGKPLHAALKAEAHDAIRAQGQDDASQEYDDQRATVGPTQ